MKKLTTVLTAIVLFVSASFASPTIDVSAKIKAEFEKDFSSVTNLIWQTKDNYSIASFKMNDQEYSAAYDDDGNLLVVSRYVSKSQLPLAVTHALNKRYAGYTFSNTVIEVSAEETLYVLTGENEKYSVRIKVEASGFITIMDKLRKP